MMSCFTAVLYDDIAGPPRGDILSLSAVIYATAMDIKSCFLEGFSALLLEILK